MSVKWRLSTLHSGLISPLSSDLEKYRSLYFAEAQEQLAAIYSSLNALSQAPGDREEINVAFREAHTLKAMSATMGYGELTRAAHALEDLLARARDEKQVLNELTLRLLKNAADELSVRLQRAETSAALALDAAPPSEIPSHFASPLTSNVSVRQQDLNLLLEFVTELVANSNSIERNIVEARTPNADGLVRRERELVRELRSLTWQLNMAPLGPVFDRYTRILTELARQQNKTVRIVTQGGDVELCHAMLDALNEPFLHLLRNAITHGIEPPAERTYLGKDEAGTLMLRAERMNDRVQIEISDDGRGMDAGAILHAAFTQGLITRDERSTMNADAALRLILLPNFTMAHTVTAHAGRGIGMSVVDERLKAVGGRLEIHSDLGQGSSFLLDVPRLVGLLEVELVRVGTKVYAIPTAQITDARVWLSSEIISKRTATKDTAQPFTVLNIETLKVVSGAQLNAPAGLCLVEVQDPLSTAFVVDELLGIALMNYPYAVQPSSIPILDPATMLKKQKPLVQ